MLRWARESWIRNYFKIHVYITFLCEFDTVSHNIPQYLLESLSIKSNLSFSTERYFFYFKLYILFLYLIFKEVQNIHS